MPNKKIAGIPMTLPRETLPEYQREVLQYTRRGTHYYTVKGLPCGTCLRCTGNGRASKDPTKCLGMGGVGSITGRYKTTNMYGAGMRGAFDAMFGRLEDVLDADGKPMKDDEDNYLKTIIEPGFLVKRLGNQPLPNDLLKLRQEAEDAPSKSSIARNFGSDVHGVVEQWLQYLLRDRDPRYADTTEPFISDDHYESAHAIVEWLDKNEWEVTDAESSIYHPTKLYAGTADCIARRGSTVALMDWKTGGGIYNEAAAQIAGYALAYEELTGEKVTEGWILRSNRGGLEVRQVKDFDQAKLMFEALYGFAQFWDDFEWIIHESPDKEK